MFDRVGLKTGAKAQLNGNLQPCILVVLVFLAIDLAVSYATSKINVPLVGLIVPGVLSIAVSYFFLAFNKATSAQIDNLASTNDCAGGNLDANCACKKNVISFQTFIDGFELWLQGFLGFLWQALWIFLWSLLFIVPGIVKAIAYSQTMYILAENSHIPVRKALRMSIAMTRGHKADLFLLELSFIGWIILSALSAGVLFVVYVGPYYFVTMTKAYQYLKEEALRSGTLAKEDFEDGANYTNANCAQGANATTNNAQTQTNCTNANVYAGTNCAQGATSSSADDASAVQKLDAPSNQLTEEITKDKE